MAIKLTGSTSLHLDQAPKPKENVKLGLIDSGKNQARTYSLSIEGIAALEELSQRLSDESRIKFSMSKVIELCVFYCEDKTFNEILQKR